jgi:hypothetical protein
VNGVRVLADHLSKVNQSGLRRAAICRNNGGSNRVGNSTAGHHLGLESSSNRSVRARVEFEPSHRLVGHVVKAVERSQGGGFSAVAGQRIKMPLNCQDGIPGFMRPIEPAREFDAAIRIDPAVGRVRHQAAPSLFGQRRLRTQSVLPDRSYLLGPQPRGAFSFFVSLFSISPKWERPTNRVPSVSITSRVN